MNFLFRIKLAISRFLSHAYSLIERIINTVWGLLESLLFLRLVLKFLSANPNTTVVYYIYKYSDILVKPFNFIFPNIIWEGRPIDTVTISAMIGYAILVFLIFEILKFFMRE